MIPVIALFGLNRFSGRLSSDYKPLPDDEIDNKAALFETYTAKFDPKQSPQTVLSYLITENKRQTDLTNIDKWYERELTEIHGDFTLYKLKLRTF